MPTQIAATPTIKGTQAKQILKEAKEIPSEKSKENAERLANYFSQMMNISFVVRKEKVEDFLSGTTKGNLQKVLARADKFKQKEDDKN